MTGFTPALKELRVDDRGRVNIGSVVSGAKGGAYVASVNGQGHILLVPAKQAQAVKNGE